MRKSALFFLLVFFEVISFGQQQSQELGKVSWLRDYDQAIAQAKKENKPVLILFQEVPGCITCRNYGNNVLSNSLLVEAIENEFIPLAIHNNKGGDDARILKKYSEPSWNNPVVRIVDTDGKMIVKRVSGDYSALTLVSRMKEVLIKKGTPIPEYINLLQEELHSQKLGHTKEKYFSMYCFWSGEKQLGSLEGVVSTESGFVGGAEVVKVLYNPFVIDEKKLKEVTQKNKMQDLESVSKNFKPSPKDVHYYLQHSNFKYLNLTELQKTKINSALGRGESGEVFLSPSQRLELNSLGSK